MFINVWLEVLGEKCVILLFFRLEINISVGMCNTDDDCLSYEISFDKVVVCDFNVDTLAVRVSL